MTHHRTSSQSPIADHQRGVTLYLVVVLLGIVLAIALGVGLILVNQLKLLRDIGASMIAFHAAEAGIEQVLRIDVCLLETDETARTGCLKEASGVQEEDIPGVCKGSGALSATEEKDCRRNLVNVSMNQKYAVGDASYQLQIRDPNGDCGGNPNWGYCGTSTGDFQNVVRRVEVVR